MLSHRIEKFVGAFCVPELSGIWKVYENKGEGGRGEGGGVKDGVSRVPVGNSLSHITEKLRKRTFRCFKKFPEWKRFMHKRGMSQFAVKSFLTQSTEELSTGTLLCFSKLLVSRIVTDNRQFSRLPVKFLLSYRTKKIVGDFFCVPENFGYP